MHIAGGEHSPIRRCGSFLYRELPLPEQKYIGVTVRILAQSWNSYMYLWVNSFGHLSNVTEVNPRLDSTERDWKRKMRDTLPYSTCPMEKRLVPLG
jgi:hypothetical protein